LFKHKKVLPLVRLFQKLFHAKHLKRRVLTRKIIKAVSELGFEKPTPIQELTIPYLLEKKKDLVALAQTRNR